MQGQDYLLYHLVGGICKEMTHKPVLKSNGYDELLGMPVSAVYCSNIYQDSVQPYYIQV